MGDLSSILPQIPETVKRIYDWHKQQGDAEPQRGYLGASIIGHHCDRFLWYSFRNCVARKFDGRMYRLFETGDLEEARFVKELRAIGCEVQVCDEKGEQFAVYAVGGHVSGHMDACALGLPEAPKTWHVCEFKTHNDKSFTQLKKDGVRKAKPQHFAQMQTYMGLTGMTRALYLAKNKDTDELWAERVEYEAKFFKLLMERADRIIKTHTPPERCATRADNYLCHFCDAHSLCWGFTDDAAVPIPARTCRACCHATPEIDKDETWARWSCARHKKDLTPPEQDQGCPNHLLLPGLVSFAEPADAGQDWIEFVNASDGAHWRHGSGAGMWSTVELMRTPGPAVGDKTCQAAKDVFGGEFSKTPLIEQYWLADAELLWSGQPGEIVDVLAGLGLGDLMEHIPTRVEDAEGVKATEFASSDDGRDILIAVYENDGVAAIWEGKK